MGVTRRQTVRQTAWQTAWQTNRNWQRIERKLRWHFRLWAKHDKNLFLNIGGFQLCNVALEFSIAPRNCRFPSVLASSCFGRWMQSRLSFKRVSSSADWQSNKQVTRGHNILADGWAGASNPHPPPNLLQTLKHTQKVSKTLIFPRFNSMTTNRPTNGRTDGLTKPLIELRVRN